jgi:hypothetical protein
VSYIASESESESTKDARVYRLQGTPRQRVVLTGMGIAIADIGGVSFELFCPTQQNPGLPNEIDQAAAAFAQRQLPPELEFTDMALIDIPEEAYETRSQHTPTVATQYQKLPMITHEKSTFLGQGALETVYKTTDLYTGDVYAMKTSSHDPTNSNSAYKTILKREAEILSQLSLVSVHTQTLNSFTENISA